MNDFFGLFLMTIALIGLGMAIGNLRVAVGYRKSNVRTATCYLTNHSYKKNVYLKQGHFAYWTNFTYSYRVEGREYFVHGAKPIHPNELPKNTKVVYQKTEPKRSYIPDMTEHLEWRMFAFFFICSLVPGTAAVLYFTGH